MLTTGNHVTSRPIIDLRCVAGYLRGISPQSEGIPLARKILLADDSVTAQNMGRKILSDAGYEVVTVNNGSAALKKIAEHRPDLIVLDVYMPGYSGLEVCQRLKETQETARIPVLLTVGKLEPFKPEEAQRVRAEGFIVKPFEASELLSALSKLEDKVVPRPEPSKPGRFARAIAAVEESSRSGQDASDTGWKERLAFPGKKKKAEVEPKGQDEAAIYNPVNRDLRTVVEKPAAEHQARPHETAAVPEGLPKDVTPEELAAIAAAVAQMQGTVATAPPAELPASEAHTSETATTEKTAATAEAQPESKVETPLEAKAAAVSEVKSEEAAETVASSDKAVGASVEAGGSGRAAEEPEDVPVTMAATAEISVATGEQVPHWTAVSVPLGAEELAVSLEREMQQAYEALAAAEANHPGFVDPIPQPPAAPENFASVDAMAEPVAIPAIPEPEPAISAAAAEPVPAFVDAVQPEAVAIAAHENPPEAASAFVEQAEATAVPAREAEATPIEAHAETVSTPESEHQSERQSEHRLEDRFEHRIEHQEETAPADSAVPVAMSAVAAPSTPEPLPAPEPEPEMAKAAAASGNAPIENQAPQPAESDTVASTAAAWASWRQIRDADTTPSPSAGPSTAEFETRAPASTQAESAAMAVAAGAEKIVQEASAASPNSDPAAIASIVESVLADLRPRIVEEISKKLAGEKR